MCEGRGWFSLNTNHGFSWRSFILPSAPFRQLQFVRLTDKTEVGGTDISFQQCDYWFCCSSPWPSQTDLHGAHAVFLPASLRLSLLNTTWLLLWLGQVLAPALDLMCVCVCTRVFKCCVNLCSHRRCVSLACGSVMSGLTELCLSRHL